MQVHTAAKQLRELGSHYPSKPVKVYIQTGPDSFAWVDVVAFKPVQHRELGLIIEVEYKE